MLGSAKFLKKIRESKIEKVSCVSCNRYMAAAANAFPVDGYNKKFPTSR
jgi:hypothetical protein